MGPGLVIMLKVCLFSYYNPPQVMYFPEVHAKHSFAFSLFTQHQTHPPTPLFGLLLAPQCSVHQIQSPCFEGLSCSSICLW